MFNFYYNKRTETMKLALLYFILLYATGNVYSEEIEVYPWPGQYTLPPNSSFIKPGVHVIVQLSDNATVRELRIREGVIVTLDCTPKLNSTRDFLQSQNISYTFINITWYVQLYDFRGALAGPERIVVSDSTGSLKYNISGTFNEILNIDGSIVPSSAKQGGTGVYRCEVCSSQSACNSTSLFNNVIGDPPVVITDGDNQISGSSLLNVIGNDFCIYDGDGYDSYYIYCSHNKSFPYNPEPEAIYHRNGELIPQISNFYFTEYNVDLVGSQNTLIIFQNTQSDLTNVLGNYTCSLTNLYGTSVATTIITECCFPPKIIRGAGFVSIPNEKEIQIGSSTCLISDLKITCNVNTTTNPAAAITWKRNGETVDELVGTTVTVLLPGTYTCCAANRCGNDSVSSEILDVPDIDKGSGFVTGGNIKIGQSACIATGSNITITCQASTGQSSNTITWTSSVNSSVIIGTGPQLTVSDNGTYQCTVSNQCGNSNSERSTIQKFDKVGISGVVTGAGKCSNLKTAPPGIDFCPFIGDSLLISCTPANAVLLSTMSTNSLNIPSANSSNSGTYTCQANSSDCGISNSSLTVFVFDPARIDRTSLLMAVVSSSNTVIGVGRNSTAQDIKSGRTIELHCPYSGINTPQTTWFKVGTTLTQITNGSPPGFRVIDNPFNLILVIENFNTSSAGTYLCTTTNIAGDDLANTTIQAVAERNEWQTSLWSNCSKTCGGGTRTRTVTCVDLNTRNTVNDNQCVDPKPSDFELCNVHPCCDKDIFPAFCKLIPGTNHCESEDFKRACCCTCSA